MSSDPQFSLNVSEFELERRNSVISAVLNAIANNVRIELPAFHPESGSPATTAFLSASIMTGPYSGRVNGYRYQFEGEEDLLHLIITQEGDGPITVTEGQAVAKFIFGNVPPALIWFKPGYYSQHYYVGHDDVAKALAP